MKAEQLKQEFRQWIIDFIKAPAYEEVIKAVDNRINQLLSDLEQAKPVTEGQEVSDFMKEPLDASIRMRELRNQPTDGRVCEWGDGWKDCGGYTKQSGDGIYCADCGRKINSNRI